MIGRILYLLILLLCLSGCSTTRYVPEGELLLRNAKIKTVGDYPDVNTSALKGYIRQRPNARWFALFPLPLATYSLSGHDTTRWVNRTLRALGEEPVIFDSLKALQTLADLQQQLRNEGYLQAQTRLVAKRHGRKVDVTYQLLPAEPYLIRHVDYQIADSCVARLLADDASNRLLREGMKLDVSRLEAERRRITQLLTNNGYYRFHKEFITFQADTTAGSKLVDLTLNLGLYRQNKLPDTLHTTFRLNRINYANGDPNDSLLHLRRSVLEECTHLVEGELYNSDWLQQTYNHFGRLQAVKYTNITFREVTVPEASDLHSSNLLDCDILLQTHKPSTISFQPEGTNTSGDLGAAASLTYQNRNLFRGSEVLSLQLRGAYEAIRGLEGYSNQDFREYSVETRLQFPRFIVPFVPHELRRRLSATSEVSVLYDLQDRPEFHRRVLSGAWRYRWQLPGSHFRYQLDLLDLNYVFMPWISNTFKREYLESETTRNSILRFNYEDLFITKIGFGFSYAKGNLAIKTNVETSGNVLSLATRATGTKPDREGQRRLFNIAYAQYAKFDLDITRSFVIDANNQFVLHAALGVAYPYGNSRMLPFEKRYFAGGANSVRGWSVRSLGPGSFKERDGRINFINQTGDMKLDLNAEYRSNLFSKLSAAAFIDAGNIWTLRDYDIQPGGQFSFNHLPEQLAVSYGLGLRLNFDYFILRFDLGMKAINPAYEENEEEHFPILHPRFSRDYAFHFAVGLPF